MEGSIRKVIDELRQEKWANMTALGYTGSEQ